MPPSLSWSGFQPSPPFHQFTDNNVTHTLSWSAHTHIAAASSSSTYVYCQLTRGRSSRVFFSVCAAHNINKRQSQSAGKDFHRCQCLLIICLQLHRALRNHLCLNVLSKWRAFLRRITLLGVFFYNFRQMKCYPICVTMFILHRSLLT